MAGVKVEVVFVGGFSVDEPETMEVCYFREDWTWDGAEVGAEDGEEDEMVKEVNDEGYTEGDE